MEKTNTLYKNIEIELQDGNSDNELFSKFKKVRRQTINILEPLEIEDYVIQTDVFMSPPRWHLGHVSWFYEQLLKKFSKSYKPFNKDYSHYLNSYYNAFGEPFDKSRRGTISRPTVNETIDYWGWINKQVSDFLNREIITDEIYRMFILGFNHEWQHQELLVYDVQHLLQNNYKPKITAPPFTENRKKKEMIKIPGGIFKMGFDSDRYPGQFAYDIEMPVHKVYLNEYYIENSPVTNADYLEFIHDKGYDNYRFWLSDGWLAVNKNKWNAPLYWEKDENGKWLKADLRGIHMIEDIKNEPVTNISYFEADAYAKWAGKRLPTETEWEKAAAFNDDTGISNLFPWSGDYAAVNNANLLESNLWGTTDVFAYEDGKSYYGCYDMIGNCWEWTQSEFMAYPGFRSGFAEYNDKWFSNQKVLRGGSFGTPKDSTRNTYRNFFRCEDRWLISGFRCAKDAG